MKNITEPFKIQRQPRSRLNGLMSKKDHMSTEHILEIPDMTRAIKTFFLKVHIKSVYYVCVFHLKRHYKLV